MTLKSGLPGRYGFKTKFRGDQLLGRWGNWRSLAITKGKPFRIPSLKTSGLENLKEVFKTSHKIRTNVNMNIDNYFVLEYFPVD